MKQQIPRVDLDSGSAGRAEASVEIDPAVTKAIVWDLDGTLLDSGRHWPLLVREVAADMQLEEPSLEQIACNFHGSLKDSLQAILELDDVRAEHATSRFLEFQEPHYESIEDLILGDALRLAREAKQAGMVQLIATNRNHLGQGFASPRTIASRYPLNELITHVVSGDDHPEGHRKPNVKVLDETLGRFSLMACELVVIGDQFVDVELALALRTKGIVVQREGDALVNDHLLPPHWQEQVTMVSSLDEVRIRK